MGRLKEADPEAYEFCLLRQFRYLKNSDATLVPLHSASASISTFALTLFSSNSPILAGAAAWSSFCGAHILLWKNASMKADEFAIENASPEVLKGGLRYLEA